jgi:tRNA (guanine37-N1)-methyltransferase
MRLDVITIFPDYLAPLRLSLIGRAVDEGLIDLNVHDLRRWTTDKHRSVDDTPFGGGAGMLMRPEPWGAAFAELLGADVVARRDEVPAATAQQPRVVVPTPAGTPFTQELAYELAAEPWLVFACGRYEGLDQRVLDEAAEGARVTEVSLGDYVLGGGEVAVLAIVEAVARLLPGVIGNADSLVHESHTDGLLEGPAYTKPPSWQGRDVPAVLLSGNHAQIARWRRDQALRRTAERRPDLVTALIPAELDRRDLEVLAGYGWAVAAAEDGRARLVRTSPPVAD